MALLFLLGAAMEVGQLFSPGRTCDWRTSSQTPVAFWPAPPWSAFSRGSLSI
jgi:hypothetical protein